MRRYDSGISKPDMIFFRLLSRLCLIIIFVASFAFLYMFFYPEIMSLYKNFQKTKKESYFQSSSISKVDSGISQLSASDSYQTNDKSAKTAEKIFVAYQLGDTLLASRLIVDFLADFPDSRFKSRVLLIGAKIMNDKGDYTGALTYIQKILSETNLNNQEYSEAVLLMGEVARERKQYDSYIQSFLEQAFFRASEPTKSKLAFYLGYLLMHKGDYQAALTYFNNVIGEDGVLGRADLYYAQQMKPETINFLMSFLEQYPASKNYPYAKSKFIEESFVYAQLLSTRGYFDSAERYYYNIIKLFPNTKEGDQAKINLSVLYHQNKNVQKAKHILLETLGNDDKSLDPEALFNLGKISFETESYEDASKYFRQLTEDFPLSSFSLKAREWQELIFESLRN